MDYKSNTGDLYSVSPPTKYLTFAAWIYLVPQYKPESILMLGYAGGTVAGLVRLLYGDVPITAVDIEPCEETYGVTLIQADAKQFVKSNALVGRKFDTVIVDFFPGKGDDLCGFITSQDFADDLTKIANYIIINTLKEPDMSAYNHLRKIGTNKPSGCSNIIHYYKVHEIKDLHPFRE